MDINKILSDLGLDFSNPEIKRGASEAIEAILNSRIPLSGSGGLDGLNDGNDIDVELDPDLLQPSLKHRPEGSDEDIEINDEEELLKQVKRNDSESRPDKSSSEQSDSDSNSDESDSDTTNAGDTSKENSDNNAENADNTDSDAESSEDTSDEDHTDNKLDDTLDDSFEDGDAEELSQDTSEDSETEDEESDVSSESSDEGEKGENTDSEEDDEFDFEDEDESDEDSEEDDEFDEDDLLDDTFNDSFEDEAIKTKHNARKIKRERTLAAAKKILADAQMKKVAPALIRELERAIEALEALQEAVTKNLKDISDEEFNLLINRVFDAIDAIGNSGLTYKTDDERELIAKEIKADLAKAETRNELSAEDAEKIRAETQAVKAREKEANKYKTKAKNSFMGFQDFLNSLYRAIALQVQTIEVNDSSWSAISRRNSGVGVLQQGKRINELPDGKIPVIDFYFDQSGSWDENDIKVGEKAVQQLADLETKGKIKMNIFYFSDNVYTDAATARQRGGTSGWNDIVKNVITTQATNVIIMTDRDMEDWWKGPTALSYTVPGYVWYLWRNGENAPRLPRDLKGRAGTQQFAFYTA